MLNTPRKTKPIPHWESNTELMYFAFPKLTQMCGFWGVKHLYLLLWVYKQSPFKDYNIIWKTVSSWVTLPVSFCMTIGDGLLMIWRHYEGSFYPHLLFSYPHNNPFPGWGCRKWVMLNPFVWSIHLSSYCEMLITTLICTALAFWLTCRLASTLEALLLIVTARKWLFD